MKQGLALSKSVVPPQKRLVLVPRLLVKLEPWHRVFFRNLADLVWPRRQPPLRLSSRPASFWPDVFVTSRLPWRRFLESTLYHAAAVAALWGMAHLGPRRPQIVDPPVLNRADVVYYSPSEYLAPLNTGGADIRRPQKGEPVYSPQPIISVPPEPDNRTQTIVTPPNLKLNREVPLPNIVAWSQTQVAMPLAATARSAAELTLPALPDSVIAPPPEVARTVSHPAPLIQQAVVAPPPSVEASFTRRLGDINIGRTEVVAPAPQLPVAEQRTLAGRAQPTLGNSVPVVVPPPPSMQGAATSNGRRLISLGIHPVAPEAPVEIPAGNRRGTFAATPEGKPGAPGTPDIAGNDHAAASGTARGHHGNSSANGIPPGIFVGAGPHSADSAAASGHGNGTGDHSSQPSPGDSRLAANITPSRVTTVPRSPASNHPTDIEKQVFGDRKFYSMILNMPNLNSAGGSWVIRFAEKQESGTSGELVAPVATQKADPAYPMELMRRNVQGTVTLYAVIRSDGSVDAVRVLRGVDDRLDEYARTALLRWHFRPATKNGNAVDLEAVVMIPFRPGRTK
jgi:TonB family protein